MTEYELPDSQNIGEPRLAKAQDPWGPWTPMSTVLTAAIVLFLVVLAARLSSGALTVNLQGLHFTDLTAILLALFSIGLSVSFYHQANKSNNLFYDNTYKFTQDVSVLLGRIEAGFGERLRSLDEGYTGIRKSFDTMRDQIRHTEEQIVEQEDAIDSASSDREDFIKKIVEATTLSEQKKDELLKQARIKEEQAAAATARLVELQQQLELLKAPTITSSREVALPLRFARLRSALSQRMRRRLATSSTPPSDETLRSIFQRYLRPSPTGAMAADLIELGFTDSNLELTPYGLAQLRFLLSDLSRGDDKARGQVSETAQKEN